MTKTGDQIATIVRCGGGVIMDGKPKTADQLVKIAEAAAESGAMVIINGVGQKSTHQLTDIAEAGKGRVILNLVD
jgi:hypothetical protein